MKKGLTKGIKENFKNRAETEVKVEEKVRDHVCLQRIQTFHDTVGSSNWKMFQRETFCQRPINANAN